MMTKKRYLLKYAQYETSNGEIIEVDPNYIDKEGEYFDEEDCYTIDGYRVMSDKQVVDLLNENEQLKQQLKENTDFLINSAHRLGFKSLDHLLFTLDKGEIYGYSTANWDRGLGDSDD